MRVGRLVDEDLDRDPLHHLDVVARGILRREQTESCATPRLDAFHVSFADLVRIRIEPARAGPPTGGARPPPPVRPSAPLRGWPRRCGSSPRRCPAPAAILRRTRAAPRSAARRPPPARLPPERPPPALEPARADSVCHRPGVAPSARRPRPAGPPPPTRLSLPAR